MDSEEIADPLPILDPDAVDAESRFGSPPRREHRVVIKLLALTLASALVLAAIGATLDIAFGGSSTQYLKATVVTYQPLTELGAVVRPSSPNENVQSIRLNFTVLNTTDHKATPTCQVTVTSKNGPTQTFNFVAHTALSSHQSGTTAQPIRLSPPIAFHTLTPPSVSCWT